MIKGVCFDLFHTLVDVGSVPDHVGRYTADVLGVDAARWNQACFSFDHEITRPTSHFDSLKKMAHGIDPSIPDELIQNASDERQARFDYALVNVPDDVLTVLSSLREQGLKLALVSNASSGEVEAWPRSPMAELFHSAIFSCDVGSRKPEPDIYHAALNGIGLSAGECVFVGDGGSDEHIGAGEVGLHSILITQYLHSAVNVDSQRALVTREISHITQLPQLLEQF
ncbi:MAG: HAD family hydrolase [Gammaproteobacteria bacterium]|nr:HAD family hydrolase [Gammaproteobacteria bacterium]